jgi:hypothetical protein
MLTLMNVDITEAEVSEYLNAHASGPIMLLREIADETAKRYEHQVDMCVSAD